MIVHTYLIDLIEAIRAAVAGTKGDDGIHQLLTRVQDEAPRHTRAPFEVEV